ncbi:MAG: cytochrome ubiquinol oxidase subunit I [Muribaculaceae bacterium]|nr:cytochrome ubiquinol oxidase subunit I [Muribaculaceae bacterium]
MNDLMNVVDWSRAQFALTAIVHWLFVPLTIGLSLIVALMETKWYRTRDEKWLRITRLWMKLFGINFACGVATGIILEFEFGTNWSNYSWFVGDIFGAPLAIEGIFAFFLESTFIAVMFFGWKKVSRGFHLASTWLTALGVVLSALWILVANAWMQYPAGMKFDPAQMRNVMDSFGDVALSPVAINKFFHTVLSGWVLGAVFVIGVSCYLLLKKNNREVAVCSIKVAGWVGLAGILLTMWTGDGSAVEVSRVQPMKLAAMEGLYRGECGQGLVGMGILDPDKKPGDDRDAMLWGFEIPKGLSILAKHDPDAFVPGIDDLIEGVELTADGDTVHTVSYAGRIEAGKRAQAALADYDAARMAGDEAAMADAARRIDADYRYFGYGYLDSPYEAVPPVALTFYAFRIMVMAGGYLLLFMLMALFMVYKRQSWLDSRLVSWVGLASIAVVWICSEAGWVVAEVGRQPWVIQDLMPSRAAVSAIDSGAVQLTFWVFVAVFTMLLAAEVSIMVHEIRKDSKRNILE